MSVPQHALREHGETCEGGVQNADAAADHIDFDFVVWLDASNAVYQQITVDHSATFQLGEVRDGRIQNALWK